MQSPEKVHKEKIFDRFSIVTRTSFIDIDPIDWIALVRTVTLSELKPFDVTVDYLTL